MIGITLFKDNRGFSISPRALSNIFGQLTSSNIFRTAYTKVTVWSVGLSTTLDSFINHNFSLGSSLLVLNLDLFIIGISAPTIMADNSNVAAFRQAQWDMVRMI